MKNLSDLKKRKELLKQNIADIEEKLSFENPKESLSAITNGLTDQFLTDKIELNIDKIQEIHDMDLCYFNGSGNFKIQLIDRFLETSANKDSAINEIYQSLEKRGENINSKDNLPFINMIKKHTKQEQNEIQAAFTQTAPKPSTRRRM